MTQSLRNLFNNGEYFSLKHDTYFHVYETLFSKYIGKPVTFVEIGVLNGGSLFMWRNYFGDQATIIGIDLNPAAKKWEKDGFKIFIGSQSDPAFWDNFFKEVGNVDIILDDGGHTNNQQIITVDKSIPYIKDGGVVVVEDVHTSYFHEFGNPSRYSFINYAKRLVDSVNSRFPSVNAVKNKYGEKIYSIAFYESIVSFHVDSTKCIASSPVQNNGKTENAADFRYHGSFQRALFKAHREFSKFAITKWLFVPLVSFFINRLFKFESRKTKKYFK